MKYAMRIAVLSLLIASVLAPVVRAEEVLPANANKFCPVMTDQPTRADRFVDYHGKRVYFCCDKCLAKFQREPARFIANLDPTQKVISVSGPAFSKPLWQL